LPNLPVRPVPLVRIHAPPRFPASPLSSEQWIGQRVLLAVGVVALILAAGYLLRLSFDRGWISPIMRCIGGASGGLVVGAVGWRLQRQYRTYGAALIGCGAAIIYLSVWAAARLYSVLPPATGILGLALVSIALAMMRMPSTWKRWELPPPWVLSSRPLCSARIRLTAGCSSFTSLAWPSVSAWSLPGGIGGSPCLLWL